MAATVTGCIVLPGCGRTGQEAAISFIDRQAGSNAEDPLALIIGIDESGKLTLNQIETGTVADPGILNAKLRTIFEDRKRSSINENEILIEMVGTIAYEDIDTLIKSLKPLGPIRITVVNR